MFGCRFYSILNDVLRVFCRLESCVCPVQFFSSAWMSSLTSLSMGLPLSSTRQPESASQRLHLFSLTFHVLSFLVLPLCWSHWSSLPTASPDVSCFLSVVACVTFLSPRSYLLTASFMWLHPVFVSEVWEPRSLKIEAFVFPPALAEIYFFCVLLHLFDLVPATSRKGRLSSDSLSLSIHREEESQTWMGSCIYSRPHWETSFAL